MDEENKKWARRYGILFGIMAGLGVINFAAMPSVMQFIKINQPPNLSAFSIWVINLPYVNIGIIMLGVGLLGVITCEHIASQPHLHSPSLKAGVSR